jgi:threonine dehydrogenase-like Zn-dependent dehydrogenase
MSAVLELQEPKKVGRQLMKANVFRGPGKCGLEEKPIPQAGVGEAVVRVKLTTICGTDIHIVRGEYRVPPGLTIGHEAVGVIHELGNGVTGYHLGQRVLVGAITPCGQCEPCLAGNLSQCGGAIGGWRFGNSIDGMQAEYVLVPFAQANLAAIPDRLADEDVLMLADIASTGFAAAESGGVRLGDMVAVFAQGPVGLCATLGAKLRGASHIFAVDEDRHRLQIASQFGATRTILAGHDPVALIREMTDDRGVDVAIEALGTQETFESALSVLKPGGTLSSVGVYSAHLQIPLELFGAGIADRKIVTTLCPGGKERMLRLMRLVESRRIDLKPLITHYFTLDEIAKAYALFAGRLDNVLKVGIRVG